MKWELGARRPLLQMKQNNFLLASMSFHAALAATPEHFPPYQAPVLDWSSHDLITRGNLTDDASGIRFEL